MVERDWHDFGCALAEAYPHARYYLEPDFVNFPEEKRPQPPTVPV